MVQGRRRRIAQREIYTKREKLSIKIERACE
jgi:hypothetical protein